LCTTTRAAFSKEELREADASEVYRSIDELRMSLESTVLG
jgi:hypothetical protein